MDANVIVDKYCPSPVLVRVCEEGKVEFVEVLLKYGADVSIIFVREKHAMCMQNVSLTVRLTPEQIHTQPSPSGMVDQVPLLVATGNGHADIVQLLVQHGANVNTQVTAQLL